MTATVPSTRKESVATLGGALKLLVVVDVSSKDSLTRSQHTLEALTVKLDALQRAGGCGSGLASGIGQQRNFACIKVIMTST